MPEAPNEAAVSQRRANWVGLRTLRQLPKAVGETDEGELIYEIRSVRLLLPGTSSHFVQLTRCSRCMRDLGGAPVLSLTDLDRAPRPMICADCVRRSGGSRVWAFDDAASGDPLSPEALAPGKEEPEPVALVAPKTPPPAAEEPFPPPVAGEAPPPATRITLEGHLRALTERVNELGRIARAQQADAKGRAEREEADAAARREELAALRALAEDGRAEVQRLAAAQAELEQRPAQVPPVDEAGAGALGEEVARLGRLLEDQRTDLAAAIASLVETQEAHRQLVRACQVLEGRVAEVAQTAGGAGQADLSTVEALITDRLAEAEERLAGAGNSPDLASVEELVASRIAEAERRLAHQIVGQWGDLETAIEASVVASTAGLVRAQEELAGGQAVLEARVDELAGQVERAFGRLESLLDRLDSVEEALREAAADRAVAIPPTPVPAGSLLDSLDRQLEAAARRLAARSQAGSRRDER